MICQDAPRARCYLEVNTAAIANNLAAARELLKPETRLIAVLKADAYGYGLRTVGRFLWTQGVRHFAVACLSEAFELRDALPEAWILCMGESLDGALDTAIRQDIRLTVGACDAAQRVSQAAQQTNTPARFILRWIPGCIASALRPIRRRSRLSAAPHCLALP